MSPCSWSRGYRIPTRCLPCSGRSPLMRAGGHGMRRAMDPSRPRLVVLITAAVLALGVSPAIAAPPAGEAVMAWHVTLAPTWFDPSTAPPQITPFGMLYAIHDAPVRPLPGPKMGASLAESRRGSPGGRGSGRTLSG